MTAEQIDALIDEEMRVKIAEACGYHRKPLQGVEHMIYWHRPNGEAISALDLPRFSNNLNAMHEAEAFLLRHESLSNKISYYCALCSVINPHGTSGNIPVWHATARQRARAFLMTI